MSNASTYINGVVFHHRMGTVLLPEADAQVFSSPVVNHVGGQKSPRRGPGFSLTLTKYNTSNLLFLTEQFIRDLNGEVISLSIDGINYTLPTYGQHRFFVSQSRVVWSGRVAEACGYVDGESFNFAPAAKVVAQITMYAVPYRFF